MRRLLCLSLLALLGATCTLAQQYELVIENGRVIDPETKLDAVRNVAVQDGKIVKITTDTLKGKRTLHASGLVVSPGFIDLHQHSFDTASLQLKAQDGVTTALELEIGASDVKKFLAAMQGSSLINYGTSASHLAARSSVFGTPIDIAGTTFRSTIPEILPKSGPATNEPATPEQIAQMEKKLSEQLAEGALSVGMGLQYAPGASRLEVIDMFRLAAKKHVPVYTHMRYAGRAEPGSAIEAVEEVISAAAISGAPLHIVHINSTCLANSLECLSLVDGARARGLDITTEAYPYIAGMTAINSALFNPGWQKQLGIDYSDLMLPDTGERLNKERFEELHNSSKQTFVIIFANKQEVVDAVIPYDLVMIASDGALGHPRNAGTYSRVLAQYVREKKLLPLSEAIRKMSLLPAQMLERSTPDAKRKGRLQEGADADIAIFDPQTVADQSTFQKPTLPSTGMRYVLVGGTLVVDEGKPVSNVFPGKALVGTPQNMSQ